MGSGRTQEIIYHEGKSDMKNEQAREVRQRGMLPLLSDEGWTFSILASLKYFMEGIDNYYG